MHNATHKVISKDGTTEAAPLNLNSRTREVNRAPSSTGGATLQRGTTHGGARMMQTEGYDSLEKQQNP